MLKRRLYYAIKPLIPWRWRNSLRRRSALRRRAALADTWPILPRTATPPPDWPGWPEGRQFAFVLTHDVEGPDGLAKCRQLLEVERRAGFVSSFNFVPEGEYRVSEDLRQEIVRAGGEVGVHDLAHDGTLFAGYSSFRSKAARINGYARAWGATGYRSGFMLRNLDWMHHLDIEYDLSTFDTDPFEMQPEGTGTIFPYWLPTPAAIRSRPLPPGAGPTAADRGGYLELPYTMAQDSTLFLVLRETDPDIWLRKLDWIAQHGGMALVNVHPDYINFDGSPRVNEYPLQHYTALLDHVRTRYAGRYWNPTPGELTRWHRSARPVEISSAPSATRVPAPTVDTPYPAREIAQLRGRRAAVLLYSNYPFDPRPRRAAEALIDAGMTVDLHSLGDPAGDLPRHELINGVNVSRLRLKHRRGGPLNYLWQYGRFLGSCLWFLSRKGFWHRYDVVHVHNMPDILAFAAIVPKLRGAAVILDLHDPMPELMTCIYGFNPDSLPVRILRRLERWSIGFADMAITPNLAFKHVFAARSCPADKVQIVMNCPEESIFDPDQAEPANEAARSDGGREFRIMHHGSILHRHGLDLLVEAVALLAPDLPEIRLDLYGRRDPFLDVVLARAAELGIAELVRYHGGKSQAEIARAIRHCDVGVVPNRRNAFTDINFPTRLFEYLAMKCPVIAPATRGIADYFDASEIITFEPENVPDLAAKILRVRREPEWARGVVENGRHVYRQHLWRNERHHFVKLVHSTLKPLV